MLCDKMLVFYNRLKTRAFTTAEKVQKADDVCDAARAIRAALIGIQGNEVVNYYLHCAIVHLPEQIRLLPVDIFDASGCALEHAHIEVKRTLL
jgi:hypothetical protein